MVNLCLIIDSEKSFLLSKVEEIYKSWGFIRQNVKECTEWTGAIQSNSLFGDKFMQHLNLEDKNDMKKFVKLISSKAVKEQFKNNWFGDGLIITCTTAQGARKIETLVNKCQGNVYKKEKPEQRKEELLKSINLSSASRQLVNNFVGEDYQLLLSFVKEMNKLSKEEQHEVSVDKVLTYFPPTPGSIPPWIFINSIMEGKTLQALKDFNRTIKNTHILVPMVFLQRNISKLLRIAIVRKDIPNAPKKLAAAIGEKPYGGFWPLYYLSTRTSIENVERAALEVCTLENDIKGKSKVDANTEFKTTIIKLGLLLNHK